MLRTDIYPCTIDNFMLAVLSNPNSPPHSMNRLKRLAAILLSPTEDLEQAHAALEAAGVPVSFADCRNCPNPCEDGKRTHSSISSDPLNRLSTGHEEYPQKIASMIDTTSDMLGSVKPYRRQVRLRSLSRNVILCVVYLITCNPRSLFPLASLTGGVPSPTKRARSPPTSPPSKKRVRPSSSPPEVALPRPGPRHPAHPSRRRRHNNSYCCPQRWRASSRTRRTTRWRSSTAAMTHCRNATTTRPCSCFQTIKS